MANRRTYTDEQLVDAIRGATHWADVMEALGKARNRNADNVRAVAKRLGIDTTHLDKVRTPSPHAITGLGVALANTSAVGTRTEGIILAALLRAGMTILLPFGSGHRYDLAVDDDGKLVRVQCKTASYREGCVVFKTASDRRDGSTSSYIGDVDVFGVYCPGLDKVYLVPISDVPAGYNRCFLRVDSPKKNFTGGVRYARDYELHTHGGVAQPG